MVVTLVVRPNYVCMLWSALSVDQGRLTDVKTYQNSWRWKIAQRHHDVYTTNNLLAQ